MFGGTPMADLFHKRMARFRFGENIMGGQIALALRRMLTREMVQLI